MSDTRPDIERMLYDGRRVGVGVRTLLGHELGGESVEGWAQVAHEAIRAMNHITGAPSRTPMPAPVAYALLGNLAATAHALPQLLEQIEAGVRASLSTFDVYDENRRPDESVQMLEADLGAARTFARQLAAHLDGAQMAINAQGYNDDGGTEDQSMIGEVDE